MKKIDVKLYEYIRNNSNSLPKNELFYLQR